MRMLLQNLVPVLAFQRRKVNVENQAPSSGLGGNGCDSQTDHLHQFAPRSVGIERRHDFGPLRQPLDGRLHQSRLLGVGRQTDRGQSGFPWGSLYSHTYSRSIAALDVSWPAHEIPVPFEDPPSQPPQCDDWLLLFFAQDIAHVDRGYLPSRQNQRPERCLSLAGFEVTLYGRFWGDPRGPDPHSSQHHSSFPIARSLPLARRRAARSTRRQHLGAFLTSRHLRGQVPAVIEIPQTWRRNPGLLARVWAPSSDRSSCSTRSAWPAWPALSLWPASRTPLWAAEYTP